MPFLETIFTPEFSKEPFFVCSSACGFKVLRGSVWQVLTSYLTQTSLSSILQGVGWACRCSKDKLHLANCSLEHLLVSLRASPPPSSLFSMLVLSLCPAALWEMQSTNLIYLVWLKPFGTAGFRWKAWSIYTRMINLLL